MQGRQADIHASCPGDKNALLLSPEPGDQAVCILTGQEGREEGRLAIASDFQRIGQAQSLLLFHSADVLQHTRTTYGQNQDGHHAQAHKHSPLLACVMLHCQAYRADIGPRVRAMGPLARQPGWPGCCEASRDATKAMCCSSTFLPEGRAPPSYAGS